MPRIGIRNTEHEKKYLESLELFSERILKANKRGRNIRWYGHRLEFLLFFYRKKRVEVATVCFTSAQNVGLWIANATKPGKLQIKRIAFMFEVEPEFFLLPEITVTIKEQKSIVYEKETAKKDKETYERKAAIREGNYVSEE